jgi:hypothetical protein
LRLLVRKACLGKLGAIIRALDAPRRLAGALDGRQQERDQRADNRYDDQKLDKGKTATIFIGQPILHSVTIYGCSSIIAHVHSRRQAKAMTISQP